MNIEIIVLVSKKFGIKVKHEKEENKNVHMLSLQFNT